MSDKNKILAIIPARGGSKGIPNKNIVKIGGKPLIAWTIEAAKKSKYIDKIVVSSDSDKILNIAAKYGAMPIKRPARLATDKASPEPLIFQVLKELKKKHGYMPEIIVYLQPTSPLRNHDDIDAAVKIMTEKKATALVSTCKIEKKFLKTFITRGDGYLKGSVNNKFPFLNRQQLPDVHMPNGAIFAIYRKEFEKRSQLFSEKTIPYVMSLEKSFDLDTVSDLENLKKYLRKRRWKRT